MFKELLEKTNNKWVRLITLVIVSINSAAMILGKQLIPYTDEEIAGAISIVAMVIVELWNHWKNNSYTKEAKHADVYLKARKKKKKEIIKPEVSE